MASRDLLNGSGISSRLSQLYAVELYRAQNREVGEVGGERGRSGQTKGRLT